MLEDDPSQSDFGGDDPFADALVEPDAETVNQPPGIESQLLVARAQARFTGEDANTPVVVGRYRITRRLGAGAMGMVFAGYDDGLAREVAIKLLQTRLATSEESRQRLLREAQAMARLSHPNVAHVYEVGEHEGRFFIAMELVAGRTMRQWHRERDRGVVEIVDMHLQAARGLAAAHEVDLVHRDYKPDNVMIDDRGRPRVMDFGLARHTGEQHPSSEGRTTASFPAASASAPAFAQSPLMIDATATGTVMGTPAYMAAEQMLGRRIDHRADQFAFCVALFEALHGHRPFAGTTTEAVLDSIAQRRFRSEGRGRGVPRGLETLVRRGLSLDPKDRFASMHVLADALELYGSHAGLRGLVHRGRWWAAGAVLASGGVIAATWDGTPRSDATPAAASASVVPAAVDPWQAIVDASDLPTPVAEPVADDPTHVTVHRLRNGLTIYLAPRPGVPSIDTAVVVRADSSDETPGQAGVSTLLQAILGDSDRLGSSDPIAEAPLLAREHEALRALSNADETTRASALEQAVIAREARERLTVRGDEAWLAEMVGLSTHSLELGPGTVWTRTVPGNRLTAWASMVADSLRRPMFRGFIAQIHAEIEGRRSQADDALAVSVARGLGEGSGRTLDALTATMQLHDYPFVATEAFWRDHYRPNNIAIVMVGEVSVAETLPVLEAAFGDWEPAALPARHVPPREITGRRALVDDEPAMVVRAWPRRDGLDEVDATELFLARSGFAERWLAADGRGRFVSYDSDPWIVQLAAVPAEGRSLDDAEAALADLLDALADGAIDDDTITRTRAQAELAAARHASGGYELSLLVAESFARRTEWDDHLSRFRGDGLDRAAIARGASALRSAGGVIVRREHGAPAATPLLPTPVLPSRIPGASPPSAFAAALAAAPVSRLEPQFLLAGRSFTEHTRGDGRVIAVDHDVPMLELQWIVPLGVADDPWICDAWRAHVIALQAEAEIAGASIELSCGVHSTTIHVGAVARRREDLWPTLAAIAKPSLSLDAAAEQVASIADERKRLRDSSERKAMSFAVVAMRGEQGVDAHMPDDPSVARSRGHELVAALARGAAVDPDVLVAGPQADAFARAVVDRVATVAPADGTKVARRPLPLLGPRDLDRTTVFVLDDPGRVRAEVRAVLVASITDVATRVGIDSFFHVETPRLPTGSAASHVFSWPRPRSFEGRTTVGILGIECVVADVPRFAEAMLAALHTTPQVEALRQALLDVELDLRATRRLGMHAARDVWAWPQVTPDGGRLDPAMADWTTLTEVDPDDLLALHARLVEQPVVVSVIADLDTVDLSALAAIGPIVRVPTEALRDPGITDAVMYGVLDH